jgi:hypothetical protein
MAGRKPAPATFDPTEAPGKARINMTVDEMHSMLEGFKSLFEDSTLAKYIRWAGVWAIVGGLCGIALVLIELVKAGVDIYLHFQK